jgi:hypothetical protein
VLRVQIETPSIIAVGTTVCAPPFPPRSGSSLRGRVHFHKLSSQTPLILAPVDRILFWRIAQLA